MYYQNKFYINGEWVNPISSATLAVINPATEQEIGSIVLGSTEDVDIAVAAAKQAFQLYSQTSVGERVSLLQRIIEAYQDHYDEIAQAIMKMESFGQDTLDSLAIYIRGMKK